MPKNKIVNGLLDWLSEGGKSGKVSIENKALFETLAEDAPVANRRWYSSKRLRYLLIISTAVVVLTSVVYYSSAFINDVILFKTEMHVNEQGALNPQKALNCEYAMYLFNASESWANTGVRLNKGDRYRIVISGGTNSAITDILESARNNTEPEFGWISYDKPDTFKNESLLDLCLSKGDRVRGGNKVNFGSMLYTIQPEGADVVYSPQGVKTEDIHKWEPRKSGKNKFRAMDFVSAEESGLLYLAVNDVVFSEREDLDIASQFRKYNEVSKSEGQIDSLSGEAMKMLKLYNSYFYRDNLGQILVSVEIIRAVSYCTIDYPLYAYRDFVYSVRDHCWVFPLIWFIVKIVVFYAICMAIVWGMVVFAYFLGHLIKKYALSKVLNLCN